MANYLIYATATYWDEPPRSRHQIANELKKKGTVYFIEKNKIGLPKIVIKRITDNIFLITPFFLLDYRIRCRLPVINEIFHNWLLIKIFDIKINFEIVISFDLTGHSINKYFKNVIYYSGDDNVGNGYFNPFWINYYHTQTEKSIARNSQVCIVTSNYMLSKLGKYNPNTFLVPLGSPSIKLTPKAYKDKKADLPTLGLVAYIDKRMPIDLLEELLAVFKIVFIGPCDKNIFERLSKFDSAVFVGSKIGEELFDCISQVDVCIAPYDLSTINRGVTPNKMWLYLALGKPCVVTDIPNIKDWSFDDKIIYKCQNDDFIDSCLLAHREDSYELNIARVKVAELNSWEKRVETIIEKYYYSINKY